MADIRAAGAILYFRNKKQLFFLVLRSSRHGAWGPPKGKAESGETDMETAMREVYEEAGLRSLRFDPAFKERISYEITSKGKTNSKEVVFFLAEMDSTDFRLSPEHTEAHFGTLEELEQLVKHEDVKAVYRKAAAYLKANSGTNARG